MNSIDAKVRSRLNRTFKELSIDVAIEEHLSRRQKEDIHDLIEEFLDDLNDIVTER